MIPESVKVGGIRYTVVQRDGLKDKFELLGQVQYPTAEIEIDAEICKDRKEQVFVHELLHACLKEAGYDDHDEDLVHRLSIVLYQVLKENKLHFG